MNNNSLSAFFVLEDHYTVLEVKVDPELIGRQIYVQKLARLQCDFLALDFLKQIEMLSVKLHCVHLRENGIQSCLILR